MCFRRFVCSNRNRFAQVRELLSNNSLFGGQLYEYKSLALRSRDLIFITRQFTARADLFLLQPVILRYIRGALNV